MRPQKLFMWNEIVKLRSGDIDFHGVANPWKSENSRAFWKLRNIFVRDVIDINLMWGDVGGQVD